MMKRELLTLTLIFVSVLMMAVPAKRGLWRNLRLSDGSEVKAQLMGDEHLHHWKTADGRRLMESGDSYTFISDEQLKAKSLQRVAERRSALKRHDSMNMPTANMKRKVQMGERYLLTGEKKGLVILAEFSDVQFKAANGLEKYKKVLNEEGYTSSEGFKGSVSDYFKAQSGGLFVLKFDVVGPVKLSQKSSYYGANDVSGNDKYAEEMIVEACKAVDETVDFSDYDWDGDGKVDQVFVLYAGQGEADGGASNTIWPHEYELSATDRQLTLDDVLIDTYACSNEVTPEGHIEGIGVFCHEFSHCMGFPDFYDVTYSGNFGMSSFDLMDMGSYNGDSFVPAGYTAYEKMMVGWLEPIVLGEEDVFVDGLEPLSEGGGAYIIYNDAHPDEYYMLENRQLSGWDAGMPSKGLMITHVDYDQEIWQNNIPNSILTNAEAREYGYTKGNEHQRMTIFHADNNDDSKYWKSSYGYYTKTTLATDLYPYRLDDMNDSLTSTSKPAATLYNANTDGRKMMGKAVTSIKQLSNGAVSFNFRAKDIEVVADSTDKVLPEGMLFYESFDDCQGTGGNDGLWSGSIASKTFEPDNEGWDALASYGAYQCARFGTSKKSGMVSTPYFNIGEGSALITFLASAWSKDGNELQLSLEGDATISPTTLTIGSAEWVECKATITGNGLVRVTFTPEKRLFLDEVLVMSDNATGIVTKTVEQRRENAIYTLDGRYVGDDASALPAGLYIIGGRKVVK